MEKSFNFKISEILKNYQQKPTIFWVLLGLTALGVILLLSSGNERPVVPQNESTDLIRNGTKVDRSYSVEEHLESELTKTLEQISGAGKVRVDLILKSGNRRVWERQNQTSKRVSQEQGVINTEESNNEELVFAKDRDGQDNPILKEELAPEIQGVVIVASGASNSRVKELLTETVMIILGLPAHRVLVTSGRAEGGN